ncbi:unnamed protein product, partial [Rotaria sp. Silwood1]
MFLEFSSLTFQYAPFKPVRADFLLDFAAFSICVYENKCAPCGFYTRT